MNHILCQRVPTTIKHFSDKRFLGGGISLSPRKMSSPPSPPSPPGVGASPSDQLNNLHNVFVYGSLLADDVVRVLLKRIPQSSSAVLNDYHRFSIKGRVYPAILPVEKKRVDGKVLLGITNPELDILDTFEDVEYERSTVEVSLEEGSDKLSVHAYVWVNKSDPDLYGEWNIEEWKRSHMDDFVKMTTEFVKELQLPEPKPRVATYESFYLQGGGDDSSLMP